VLLSNLSGIADKISNQDTNNKEWFSNSYYAENFEASGTTKGIVDSVSNNFVQIAFINTKQVFNEAENRVETVNFKDIKSYSFVGNQTPVVTAGMTVKPNDKIATGEFTNNVFYKFIGRMLLLSLLAFLSILLYISSVKRRNLKRESI
jgi:hypothetical protein